MKPKIIGIVGGAGPLAGVSLLERLFTLLNQQYDCYRDADYPQVFLNSFPFSEMLTPEKDEKLLQNELTLSLNQLRSQGAEVLAIACNTLHNFLETDQDREDLIHLPRLLGQKFSAKELPLVFCTSTSKDNQVHRKSFECNYPEDLVQIKVDEIIDRTLKGTDFQLITRDLLTLIEETTHSTIVLGCTELSLFTKDLSGSSKVIIDPLEILAEKILEKSFKK